MKKIINYKLLILSVFLLVIAVGCQESQSVAPIASTANYPTASFTFDGGSTTFNELDEPVFVYNITLDKMIDRSINFNVVQSGGNAVEGVDYEVVNTSVAAFSKTAQITISFYKDFDPTEGTKTLELSLVSNVLSNQYLLNPSTTFPKANFEISDWVFCNWTLVGSDFYDDGWNGAYIRVSDSLTGETVDYGLESGDPPGTQIDIPITDGAAYTIEFVSGDWDGEIAYTLTSPDGNTVLTKDEGSYPTPGVLTTGTQSCN